MTPKAQRIAIAEAVPKWRPSHGGKYCTHIERNLDDPTVLPGIFDPLSDLNACHEMENVLPKEQKFHYRNWLFQVVGHAVACGAIADDEDCHFLCIHASAAQRSEAFLRTLNLWDDSK